MSSKSLLYYRVTRNKGKGRVLSRHSRYNRLSNPLPLYRSYSLLTLKLRAINTLTIRGNSKELLSVSKNTLGLISSIKRDLKPSIIVISITILNSVSSKL